MTRFLISLDEVARIKRLNGIGSNVELAKVTNVSRNTWTAVFKERKPTPQVLDALARLGARPDRVLIADEMTAQVSA